MPLPRLLATPAEIGVDRAAMEDLFQRVSLEVSEGRVEGCQVAIARHGRVAGSASFGSGGGRPVTDSTLFCCFSCTKATGAVAAWQLIDEGKISLDARVVDYIPEFATNGKEVVTIKQLVTFTAGFPNPKGSTANLAKPAAFSTSAARCAEFEQWELEWEPGSRWEYHPLSAHWVLMEIVERVTGLEFRDYLRTRVLDPAGLSEFWVGCPEELQPQLHFADIVTFPEQPKNPMASWNSAKVRALGVPAGGGWVCASDLALLYQPLLNGGHVYGGGQICTATAIKRGTTLLTDSRHTDMGGRIPKLRGIVMELAGDDGDISFPANGPEELRQLEGQTWPKKVFRQGGFGSKVSAQAFGHDGAGGQIAWADPQTGISVAFVHNTFGPMANPGRVKRDMEISDLAAVCAADPLAKAKL